MKKIESIPELTELVTKIRDANSLIEQKNRQAGWFDLASSQARRNNEIISDQLPSELEVSPAIASFLALDQKKFDEKAEIAFQNSGYLWEYLKLIGSINLAILSPVAGGVGAAASFSRLLQISNNYEALVKQRDEIAAPVLGEYLLTEKDGKYQRGCTS